MIYCSHDRVLLTFFCLFVMHLHHHHFLPTHHWPMQQLSPSLRPPKTHRHIAKQLSSAAVGEQVWMMPPSHGALPGEPTGEPVRHILACQFSPLKSFTPKIYSVHSVLYKFSWFEKRWKQSSKPSIQWWIWCEKSLHAWYDMIGYDKIWNDTDIIMTCCSMM